MIFELSSFLIVILVIFVIYCIKSCTRPKNFPNGPFLLPFIGSAWTIPVKGMEFLIPKWTKKYGDTIGHKFYYEKLVIFCATEDIFEGLKHVNFQGRYQSKLFLQRTCNKPLGFFFGDNETWSEVRRFTLRYLGTVFNAELETILHDDLLEEFAGIRSGKVTDINGMFMKSPLNVILKILTGSCRKNYQRQIDELQAKTEKAFILGRVIGIELVYPIFKKLFHNQTQEVEAVQAVQSFLNDRLREHKEIFNAQDIRDYTDAYINESKKEQELYGKVVHFTDDEFLSCGVDMVQAGNESTGKTIEFILMYVALNDRVQSKLHEEIDRVIGQNRFPQLNDRINMPYLDATMHEGMRINPISPIGGLHRVTEDTTFKGYFLEKDTLIYFALKHAMNNPEYWKNPDEFIPERFFGSDRSKKKLPNFGLGKRSCIGEMLVKNFMFLYLAYFFQRFSVQFPIGYQPSTYPLLGHTNGPVPFKLIITERERE